MPTVTGGFQSQIELMEVGLPTPGNPQPGVMMVDFAAHRQAKKDRRVVRVNSIACKLTIQWLNKNPLLVGHTFYFKVANESGVLQQVIEMGQDSTKTVMLDSLYPSNNKNGIFGLNGVQLDSICNLGVYSQRDVYRVTNVVTVNYDIL